VAAADHPTLVLVMGPGRSGTSTIAGALAHSGYVVPRAIKGNQTNPAGFFEPRWVVNLHRRLLGAADVGTLDTDPGAMSRLEATLADQAVQDELYEWLAPQLEIHGRLVIKDPRMIWFRDLWADVAQRVGIEPRSVIMLRHPSEVSSSRSSYYNAGEIPAVAGWINVALLTEQLTSGSPRALVHYPSLTADWRSELVRLRERLDLPLDPPPEVRPHPVDDFIDPDLRRMKTGWDASAVPAYLQSLGDRTFKALGDLAEGGESEAVSARIAELREEYARAHADAMAFVKPTIGRIRQDALARGRRAGHTAARKQQDQRNAEGRPVARSAGLPRRALRSVASRVRERRAGSREG
jgi:hypothetical protein